MTAHRGEERTFAYIFMIDSRPNKNKMTIDK